MSDKRFFGKNIPSVSPQQLTGKLIVIEGADGSGRSTQIRFLHDTLEKMGYATMTEVGLKRSELIGADLEAVNQSTSISLNTLSLFYATDFADQLEKKIIPALRAGFVVIADRYIFSLMARAIVRGVDPEWIRKIYEIAIVPDMVFYLKTPPEILAERTFQKSGALNYRESGMDVIPSKDLYSSFIKYQRKMHTTFLKLASQYSFTIINGNRPPWTIAREIAGSVERLLAGAKPAAKT